MGESAAVEAATSERDVLLATKLNVPGLRPDLVPRPRLAQRLDEGLARGLVLVCAPAGYGKTVLLAEWVRRGRHRVAWLSLDAGDNDPARFWRHTVAALDRVRPGISERMSPLLGPPAPPSFEPVVTALINEVTGQPDADEALLLILDDYHVISSQPVHESLGFLLQHRPPELHLALTSRSDPPLALARLRARGQLTELRAAELRFTPGEAAALLQQVAAAPGGARLDAPLPDAVAAALAARTEGWAAGLQLAGLSLRGQTDVDGFVAAFTGSHRYVLDYLAEEVLERQPGRVREFLLETSVLERLSGELCDAVTGRPGSQALLEQVERAGLFLMPLDEVRGWWRYHHLFADLLRARFQQEHPGRVSELHRNAAAWYAERGLADDAIRHAVAAREMIWAARLIEQHFDAVHSLRGEAATAQRWLTPLPEDLVRSRPRLLLAQAVPAATGGRLEEAEQLVDAAELAYAGTGEEPFEPTIGRAGSLLVNVPAMIALSRGYLAQLRGDAKGTAEFGSQALAESREDEWILRSVAQGQLAVAEWLDGRLDEAERAFAHGIDGRRAADLPTWGAWESYELGLVQHAQGRPGRGRTDLRAGAGSRGQTGRAPLPAAGPAYVGLADVAYQRNELGSALENVTLGHRAVPLVCLHDATGCRPGHAGVDPAGRGRSGRCPGCHGRSHASHPRPPRACSTPSRRGGRSCSWPRATWGSRALDGRGWPRRGRRAGLRPGTGASDAGARPAGPGPARPGTGAAGPAVRGGGRAGPGGSLIEIGALRALALAASGEEAAAVDALAEALNLACPQGYVRVFADEGTPMAALLARLITAQRSGGAAAEVPLGCLARLQRALGAQDVAPDAGRGSVTAVPGLVEQLTSRELEVLTMLAAGRSNQAIASQLVVTLDTVKKHVSHVLGKLGAANRTEAVTRARELNLIP